MLSPLLNEEAFSKIYEMWKISLHFFVFRGSICCYSVFLFIRIFCILCNGRYIETSVTLTKGFWMEVLRWRFLFIKKINFINSTSVYSNRNTKILIQVKFLDSLEVRKTDIQFSNWRHIFPCPKTRVKRSSKISVLRSSKLTQNTFSIRKFY